MLTNQNNMFTAKIRGVVDDLVHEGITCDVCHKAPIRGPWFQCTVCKVFNMCEGC